MKKAIVVLLLLSIIGSISKAQNVLMHEKKIYISPDNKLYYNKSLPVYFFVSSSASTNAPHYLLKSENTPQYSNPMYFDTEGQNTLRSPSAVDTITKKVIMPTRDVEYQVYVDSKPPTTLIKYNKQHEKLIKGINYVSDSLAISFITNDELSGVENTYVSLDSGVYEQCKNSLVLDIEKQYAIKYYSVDNTGNAENPKKKIFYIDKTPPKSNLNIVGSKYGDVLSGNTLLEISATDNLSGIKHILISIDDSIYRNYPGRINTSLLAQGEHRLFYYSIDEVYNKEKVNSYSFYVDKTPPQVIEEILGKTFIANGKEFSAGTSKLKITSFDNKAGVKEIFYSINKTPFIKYEKPIILSGYKGDVLVTSYAIDNVGNQSRSDISNTKKNRISYIDLGGPWVGHFLKGPSFINRDTLFINNKTNIVLEAKDSESGINRIEFQIDSSDLKVYNAPITFSNEGNYHILVYGYDNTENLTRQSFGVTVDTTGPEIFERFSSLPVASTELDGKNIDTYSGPVVVFLSATDKKSGFETLMYKLNDGIMQPYLRDIRNFLPGKKNRLKVQAIDKLGNQSVKVIEFYIK